MAHPAEVTEARTRFRLYTGETDTAVLPDSEVDAYLQDGIEATSAALEHYVVEDAATLTLTPGINFVTLPDDFVSLIYAYHNGRELTKGDLDQWRIHLDTWLTEPGSPSEYALVGDRLILRKVPNAAAVAAAPALTVKYVAGPPSVTTSSFPGLLKQDRRLPVYWAVVAFSAAHPADALAPYRAEQFKKLFEARVARSARYYEDRKLQRPLVP
jgi:hypothetical protein